jgi:hypothetical protein
VANLFSTEVVVEATMASISTVPPFTVPIFRRSASTARTEGMELAKVFGAHHCPQRLREGSLREAARDRGVPVIVFEGGEG